MKNKSLIVFMSSILIIFLGIFIADQLGFWNTKTSGDLFSSSQEDNMVYPDELRGSSTFQEIEDSFSIPAEHIALAYNFDTLEPGLLQVMMVSEAFAYLGDDVEMGTGSVKLFIYLYNGLDVSGLDEIENIPSTAVDILKEYGKWNEESEEIMEGYIIEVLVEPFSDDSISDLMAEEHEETDENAESGLLEINGKTTIQDIIDSGISLSEIEEILGVEVANVNLSFRDICEQNDLDFSIKKDEILSLIE